MIFSNNVVIYTSNMFEKLFSIRIKRIQDTTFQQKGREATSSVSRTKVHVVRIIEVPLQE